MTAGRKWPAGLWDNEPNEEDWEHEGLKCRIRRNLELGNLCGYVGVDATHPRFEKEDDAGLEPHGGITFMGQFKDSRLWWFGFDCAHYNDVVPGLPMMRHGTYRDIHYVRGEVELLAAALAAMKPAAPQRRRKGKKDDEGQGPAS